MAHPLQAFVTEAFSDYCNQLVQTVFPEKIFLLAARKESLLQHNIFLDPEPEICTNQFLLLIIYDSSTHDRYILQSRVADTIVANCSIHPLLFSSVEFEKMCKSGHPFAHQVIKNSLTCYDSPHVKFEVASEINFASFPKDELTIFLRARESLNFANDSARRRDNLRAVANLHQATAQALVTIIHHFTGIDYPSSNVNILRGLAQFFVYGSETINMLSPPQIKQLQAASDKIGRQNAIVSNEELSTLFSPIANLVNLCQRLIQFYPSSIGSQL